MLIPLLPALLLLAGAQEPDFGREVLPILSRRCFACHGPDGGSREAELRLDTRAGALALVVVPGDASASELMARVTAAHSERMPPEETGPPLSDAEVDTLRRWIAGGAEYTRHWAFVAPVRPAPPEVSRPAWARGPIDAFVLARLDKAGLEPSEPADRRTLARRLSLDLIGLPPTPERVNQFVADIRPDAFERYVDELLASPRFGERWARVWLDLARYADSAGHGSDPLRTIWRYRDWVIDAFNANQPFDEFTRDQLAGDLLPEPTLEQRLATAFHRNTKTNTEGGTDDEEWRVEAVKDRTDTTMQAWMGLTFGCAKCHTHKYDPISHAEYYSLFDFFNQTADTDRSDDRPRLRTPSRDQAQDLARLESELEHVRSRIAAPLEPSVVEAWIAGARERAAGWRPLVPKQALAESAQLEVLPDGTLTVAGPAPERDTYRLELELGPGRWTGLALDALADSGLPGGGPGLSPGNGNFVLSDLKLERLPDPGRALPRGRFVRFELPGAGRILSLAEVRVFFGSINLAAGTSATQSSTAYGGPASLAIDGNTSGTFEDGSVTHTATGSDPWWEVDLGAEHAIERIVFWNRTDGELHRRLDGVLVRVLDTERGTVWSGRVSTAARKSTQIEARAWPESVLFADASADFAQTDWGVDGAIDGDPSGSGWAIAPRVGRDHRAVFAFAEPLVLDRPARFSLRLTQAFGTAHVLGRLRLSVTEFMGQVRVPPAEVAQALASLPDCSPDERARIGQHVAEVDPSRAGLRAERERLSSALAKLDVVTTPVMVQLPADRRRVTHVLHKGNFLEPGQVVHAGVPAAMHPWPAGAPKDRLGLAAWITADANPLTARVAANRWWGVLFGRGIVETQEDFGSQGLAPSHPRLLDWLAVEYVSSGWDTKALLRTMVTSATYRQSSRLSPASLGGDRDGRLLSRMARVPLEAEQVRDQALAIAGLLSARSHGPSVFPPQPAGLWQAAFNNERRWVTSVGEDRYRRGLYVFWRRSVPYPSMEVFDAPNRELCSLRRTRTNTPLQAFVTLNDPVYVECAQALARRMLEEGDGAPVIRGMELCLQRPPSDRERELLGDLYKDALAELERAPLEDAVRLATNPLGPLPEEQDPRQAAAWTAVAGVLLNLDAVLNRE
jgi:Protein of unknown function (DUF1553)/Protein of unknown function (DUF1549)/Planctomycete cytochrome C/NedA-like, galactose-binding domain